VVVNLLPRHSVATPVVAMRDSGGQLLLLIEVDTAPCDNCRFGTRYNSLWSAPAGAAEQMSWCTSCFNAHSAPAILSGEHRQRLTRLREAIRRAGDIHCWSSARLAVEALERRLRF